jgi:hypothetical protein
MKRINFIKTTGLVAASAGLIGSSVAGCIKNKRHIENQ